MEKLIELLNEYNRNVKKWSDRRELKNSIDNPWTKYISLSSVWAWKIYLWIISREYWFIEWLVKKNKIDTKKVAERRKEDWWSIVNYNHDEETKTVETMIEYWTDNTLMALSVSNSPIDDLILYLS